MSKDTDSQGKWCRTWPCHARLVNGLEEGLVHALDAGLNEGLVDWDVGVVQDGLEGREA